jgi:hypothetical protein
LEQGPQFWDEEAKKKALDRGLKAFKKDEGRMTKEKEEDLDYDPKALRDYELQRLK